MDHTCSARHDKPWNKGKLVGQKAPLRVKDIWAIRVRLQLQRRTRDLALFDLGIDSKLRACDLVRLRVRDLCHGDRLSPGRSYFSRRPSVRFSSRSRPRPVKRPKNGSRRQDCAPTTTCFPVDSMPPRIWEHVNMLESSMGGSARQDLIPLAMERIPSGVRSRL
jgi:hypothetical protein